MIDRAIGEQIEDQAQQLYDDTGIELVVVTRKTLGNTSAEKLYSTYQVSGEGKQSKGFLILVALDDGSGGGYIDIYAGPGLSNTYTSRKLDTFYSDAAMADLGDGKYGQGILKIQTDIAASATAFAQSAATTVPQSTPAGLSQASVQETGEERNNRLIVLLLLSLGAILVIIYLLKLRSRTQLMEEEYEQRLRYMNKEQNEQSKALKQMQESLKQMEVQWQEALELYPNLAAEIEAFKREKWEAEQRAIAKTLAAEVEAYLSFEPAAAYADGANRLLAKCRELSELQKEEIDSAAIIRLELFAKTASEAKAIKEAEKQQAEFKRRIEQSKAEESDSMLRALEEAVRSFERMSMDMQDRMDQQVIHNLRVQALRQQQSAKRRRERQELLARSSNRSSGRSSSSIFDSWSSSSDDSSGSSSSSSYSSSSRSGGSSSSSSFGSSSSSGGGGFSSGGGRSGGGGSGRKF